MKSTGIGLLLSLLSSFALAKTPSLLEQEIDLAEQADVDASDSIKSTWFPELNYVAGYQDERLKEESEKGGVSYLEAKWNLFDGAIAVSQYRQAQLQQRLARLEAQQRRAELEREVYKAQVDLLALLETQRIEKRESDYYKQQIVYAQRRNSSGLASASDILQLEIKQDQALTHYESLSVEIAEAKLRLAALLNSDTEQLTESWLKEQVERHQHLENRNQLLPVEIAKLKRDLSEIESSQARKVLSPKLDLEAKYGQVTPQDMGSGRSNEYSAMIKLTVPLFSGFSGWNEYSQMSSKAQAEQLHQEYLIKKALADQEVRLLRQSELKKRIAIRERSLERTQKLYSLVEKEFKRGAKDSGDWMEVTDMLIEAEKDLLRLRSDLLVIECEILTSYL